MPPSFLLQELLLELLLALVRDLVSWGVAELREWTIRRRFKNSEGESGTSWRL